MSAPHLSSRKRLATVGGVVLGLVTLIWLWPELSDEAATSEKAAGAEAAGMAHVEIRQRAVKDARAAAPRHEWSSEVPTVHYRFDQVIAVDGEGPVQKTTIRCEMVVRPMEVQADPVTLTIHFRDASVSGAALAGNHTVEMLNKAVAMVSFNAAGKIEEVRLPPAVTEEDAMAVSQLVYSLQMVLGPAGREKWGGKETDSNGLSEWAYERQGDLITKRRVSLESPDANALQVRIESSQVSATLGTFWLESLKGGEILALGLPGENPLMRVSTNWVLRRIPTPSAGAVASVPVREVVRWTAPDAPERRRGSSAAIQQERETLRSRHEKLTVAQAIENISAAVSRAKEHADTVASMNMMADMLRAYPERAAVIPAMLANASLGAGVSARVLHALELAAKGEPAAQQALAQIIARPSDYSDDTLSQAVVAAGGVGEVKSPELSQALIEIASTHPDPNITNAAEKALGTLSASNEKLRETLTPGVQNMLADNTATANELANTYWTAANGKIVNETIQAQAVAHLQHPNDKVRRAALDYFAAVDADPSVRALPMLADSSPEVRYTAIRAALGRPSASREAIDAVTQMVIDSGQSQSVRVFGIRALSNHLDQQAELETLFEQISRNQADEEVRRAASSALQMFHAPAPKTTLKIR